MNKLIDILNTIAGQTPISRTAKRLKTFRKPALGKRISRSWKHVMAIEQAHMPALDPFSAAVQPLVGWQWEVGHEGFPIIPLEKFANLPVGFDWIILPREEEDIVESDIFPENYIDTL